VSPFVGVGVTKKAMDALYTPLLQDLTSLGIRYSKSESTMAPRQPY
jgi:hypothetical protein